MPKESLRENLIPKERDSSVAQPVLSEVEALHRNDMRAFFNSLLDEAIEMRGRGALDVALRTLAVIKTVSHYINMRSTEQHNHTPQVIRAARVSLALLGATVFVFCSLPAQSWYNASWTYRKAITIDYTKVGAGPHTSFPVLINRTDADLQSKAQADADDILFTSSDGTTKLDHQIESYTSATGAIV
ncbi:MAG: hypothetical protein HY961_16985, partial [Ignavibacteriae bacterium]|nr:hypothetical protein [Ignavibacteriota bacterium]